MMINITTDLFKKILDALPNNIYLKDKNGRYVWLNQSCVRLRFSQHQIASSIVDKTDFDLFPEKNAAEYVENDKLVMNSRVGAVREEEVFLPTGEKLIQLSFKEPLIDEETDQLLGILGYTIDISDKKRMENELIEVKEAAELANKSKQELLYHLRHDIRTPFAGIRSLLANYLREEESDFAGCHVLHLVHQTANELFRCMDKILELTEMEAEEVPVVFQSVNLRTLEKQCADLPSLSPRVLFVEDSVMVKLGSIPMLESLNATVDSVDSGEEAIEHVKLQDYDLIFMDIGLPGIDGYETTRRIRAMEKGKNLPIIAVTAYAMGDVKAQCDQVGMTNAIQKPLTPEDALTFFNTYLYDKGYLINESIVPRKKEDPYRHWFDMSKSIVKLGSEAAVNSYLKSLLVHLTDSLALITMLEEKKDSIALVKEAHKLKGALSLIEAPELNQAVIQLNNGLKIGQRGNVPALLAVVIEAADVFKKHITEQVIPKDAEQAVITPPPHPILY